jgi:DNA mismatch endonuclease, patch repair protein
VANNDKKEKPTLRTRGRRRSDRFTPEQRSRCMSRIRGKNTKPELVVRSLIHRLGFRFRLHGSDLPGKPDIVLRRLRKVIFVHGCFWHQHVGPCRRRARMPRSNLAFWKPKLTRNMQRDAENAAQLKADGWRVLVIWECDTYEAQKLESRLRRMLMEKSEQDRQKPAPQVLEIGSIRKNTMRRLASEKRRSLSRRDAQALSIRGYQS